MDPRQLFIDERLVGFCSYCGSIPNTRDHVPSRILLDSPFPSNLPIVEACKECNKSFAKDEEYLACFLECVLRGTTKPESLQRPKIQKILQRRPSLRNRIDNSRIEDKVGNIYWSIEADRARNIVLKLARGHLAFELNAYHFEQPEIFELEPFVLMSDESFDKFGSSHESKTTFYPEIGSRAFVMMWKPPFFDWRDWRTVQEGRYRYRIDQIDGDCVQIVLSEYLACRVVWS
jgi:hypothetical protein